VVIVRLLWVESGIGGPELLYNAFQAIGLIFGFACQFLKFLSYLAHIRRKLLFFCLEAENLIFVGQVGFLGEVKALFQRLLISRQLWKLRF
jgi:hypothetical protein